MATDDVHSPLSSTSTHSLPSENIGKAIFNINSTANVSFISMSTNPHIIKEYNAILMLTTEAKLENLLRYLLVSEDANRMNIIQDSRLQVSDTFYLIFCL